MSSTEYWAGFVFSSVIGLVGGIVLYRAMRAAYRNGVCDGYAAAHAPDDPLYESNGVNDIVRKTGRFKERRP